MKMIFAAVVGLLFLPHAFGLKANTQWKWRMQMDGSVQYRAVTGGLSCTDDNKGFGFIMYSMKSVNDRWKNLDLGQITFKTKTHTASNFVCVRWKDNKWSVDTNWKDEEGRHKGSASWNVFAPVNTDVLVASVSFDNHRVKDLKGTNLHYKGMQVGYADGDLNFFANQNASGLYDFGEYRLTGTYVKSFPKKYLPQTTTTTTTSKNGLSNSRRLKIAPGRIQCTQTNRGNGFIMYSQMDINLRWNKDPLRKDFNQTATNFLCVRYQDGYWQYDSNWNASNTSWHNFSARSTDVLVASVDFRNYSFMDLKGLDTKYLGIQTGYADGDMSITFPYTDFQMPDNITAIDIDFDIRGTFLMVHEPKTTTTTTTTTRKTKPMQQKFKRGFYKVHPQVGGFRCTDANKGNGFIMYTQVKVNERWKIDPKGKDFRAKKNAAKNFVCIRYANGSWWYDSNWADENGRPSNKSWHAFYPLPTDFAVASVDFESLEVVSLQGTSAAYRELQIGYVGGDLKITAKPKPSLRSLSEEIIDGSDEENDDDIELDEEDAQTTTTTTSTLATTTTTTTTAEEAGPMDFIVSGTYMIAYGGMKIKPGKTTQTTTTAFITSTRLSSTTALPIRRISVVTGGLSCTDNNNGTGYIMYTSQDVNSRWNRDTSQLDFRKHSAKNFVCVRYANKSWQYDCNWADEADRISNASWYEFVPASTDVLVAQVDFTQDRVVSLMNNHMGTMNGLQLGFQKGDLAFFANQWASGPSANARVVNDTGEFRITGSYIFAHVPVTTTTTTTTTTMRAMNGTGFPVVAGGISCTDANNGSGFIMYSVKKLNERFTIDADELTFRKHSTKHFVCVRRRDQKWEYDTNWADEPGRSSNVSWHDFDLNPTDILVASVDYSTKVVKLLNGTQIPNTDGADLGYKTGDLQIFANQDPSGARDDGEFRVAGTYFEKNT
eukprot:TRINITY_DN1043_c0_g2_i2.p1 TRINITY_DN1043_c0_g2~~TRINITY_DN1043_c0_g2_i2.p1  ORF type:complete len:942 (-),score=133.47 TRINITY_DN1043_c0_g2_i2:59-2884(-)